MKIKTIPSSWLEINGRRLDCGPYMSGALEAKETIEKIDHDKLSDLTCGYSGGIFKAPRISPNYVDSEMGVPYLSSSEILYTDLSFISSISKKQAMNLANFVVEEGMTLVTSSGDTGRTVYARTEMQGMIGSPHFMRIKPDEEKIPPGYLYSFLSCKYGKSLLVSGTYGSIIQAIEPHHIADMPIPRLKDIEKRADFLVQRAAENRLIAKSLIDQAILGLNTLINLPKQPRYGDVEYASFTIQDSDKLFSRMDAYYYSQINIEAREAFDLSASSVGVASLGEIADVYIPVIFKRLYADDPSFGYPYYTGKDMYELLPSTNLTLKRSVAEDNRLIVRRGMILVQDSGQLSGIIGRPVIVGSHIDNVTCTNNMVRICANSEYDNGYLFALLSTEFGIRLLKREASGSSIPHLDEKRMRIMQIPWPDKSTRDVISKDIWNALDLRDEAIIFEDEARSIVEEAIERGGL